jgi:cytochrome b6-f complex iron-sulfur subunit
MTWVVGMADKKKMSVDEILAACRGTAAGGPAEPAKTKAQQEKSSPQPARAESTESAAAAERASAEKSESKAGKGATPTADAAKSAPAPGAATTPASGMSVADILAAARGGGAPGATSKSVEGTPKAKPKPQPKPEPKATATPTAEAKDPSSRGPSAEKKVAAGKSAAAALDTSSILAAARRDAKPGPITKAEAAARQQAVAPTAVKSRAIVPSMPEKPPYAKPKPVVEPSDRRGFFSVFLGSFLALGFTAFGLTNLLWTLGLARFMFPNILIEPPSRFRVGFPSDFAPGSVADKFKAQFGVWVVNTEYEGQQQIVALKTVCTHLGCTPNWLEAEQKFKCPCHGSGFYKDGINFEGPAPRPLERYAVQVASDGQLEIDKSKTFQQEMGQWSDPASFVPV